MSTQTARPRPSAAIFFSLFALSGFSGLIYESIWTHYLKLFLGHAAYAQTLVLAIFMGGMAVGAWFCSRYSARWRNLFIGYAIAEGVVGLLAVFFHEIFAQLMAVSYDGIIPLLQTPLLVNAFKWGLSALLIMPQSILLGMTFPLMSAAILRAYPHNPGGSISLLYFTNSIGAAIGVLTSGFFLIKAVGLPGTMAAAGVINLLLAGVVWWLTKGQSDEPVAEIEAPLGEEPIAAIDYRLMLLASLVTGAASFIYEIGWIRMLSLVLGSSTHSFELMLSAFISGLAFGGLWIRRRIDRVDSPLKFLAYVQVIMGLLALSTLVFYGNTFSAMQWILRTVPKTEAGYALFNLAGNGIALAIMLPTTFCAGMTLPLITYTLLKKGLGEKSIGAVYGANTIGAILGVFLAIHLGLPLLGIKGLITFGASLDIGLGLALLWLIGRGSSDRLRPLAVTAVSLCLIAATLLFVQLDPYKMASGVYRFGALMTPEMERLVYHRDGKTATVSLSVTSGGDMSIRTNGKSDAALNIVPNGRASEDEPTMILAGVLPLALHPQATTAANIGLGSGLTTHTLLGSDRLQRVDTVEIERFMVEAAKNFGARVERVYNDPRSQLYIDDAKTFFSMHNRKYDIIVSEPSNPWVSGVAGLFSQEFYTLIRRHLAQDGVFVQWLQLYEINMDLVASVLKALSDNFRDYDVYASNTGDLIIVATNRGKIGALDPGIFKQGRLAESLARIDIRTPGDLALRRVAGKHTMERLAGSYRFPANSDYYPVLDQNAARARFMNENAQALIGLSSEPLPLIEMLEGRVDEQVPTKATSSLVVARSQKKAVAAILRDYYLNDGDSLGFKVLSEEHRRDAQMVQTLFASPGGVVGPNRKIFLFNALKTVIPYLTAAEANAVLARLNAGLAAPLLDPVEQDYVRFFAAVGQRDSRAMAELARKLLATDPAITQSRTSYLVAAGMLGSLASGEKAGASQLWQDYRLKVAPSGAAPFIYRFLEALAGG